MSEPRLWTEKTMPYPGPQVGDKWSDGTTTRTLTVFEGREVWVDYYGEVME